LIEIDCESIEIVDFENLVICMMTMTLKKLLNVIELCYELFEVQTIINVGCLKWNLNESSLEILNIYIYIYIYIFIYLSKVIYMFYKNTNLLFEFGWNLVNKKNLPYFWIHFCSSENGVNFFWPILKSIFARRKYFCPKN